MKEDRKQELVAYLAKAQEYAERGEEIPVDWATKLFPPARREYELTYTGKQTAERIISSTMAVPFQTERSFGEGEVATGVNGEGKSDSWQNKLIFGDNLQILKSLVDDKKAGNLKNADGTDGVRLVYIDPPFSTRRDFMGNSADQRAYADKLAGAQFLEWLRKRLILLKELLADNGSIYVHLDYRKGHYVKVLMDEIFGEGNFRNEIVWRKTNSPKSQSVEFGSQHDTIFIYSKTASVLRNNIVMSFTEKYLKSFSNSDEIGRYQTINLVAAGTQKNGARKSFEFKGINKQWLYSLETLQKWDQQNLIVSTTSGFRKKDYIHEHTGQIVSDLWVDSDVSPQQSSIYPTQKPEALLARIIKASSNPGDIVLDCFGGSGTTATVAEKLGRRWITCDVGKLAIYTIQKRLLRIQESKSLVDSATDVQNDSKNASKSTKPAKYGKPPRPFTLYNAGLYDESKLNSFDESEWRKFALALWGCEPKNQEVKGLKFDGTKNGDLVKVYTPNDFEQGEKITEETLDDIQNRIAGSVKNEVYIIAPRGKFAFPDDRVYRSKITFNIMRIPYSLLTEWADNFSAPIQSKDAMNINEGVDAVGFDFIQPPNVEYVLTDNEIEITVFESNSRIKGKDVSYGIDAFSMLMVDYNYNGETFNLDEVLYNRDFKDNKHPFDRSKIAKQAMLIFIDKFGNERKEVIANG